MIPLVPIWYVYCVYTTYTHTRTSIINIAREYILYSAWASRCRFRILGNAKASERGTAIVGFHAFFYVSIREIGVREYPPFLNI